MKKNNDNKYLFVAMLSFVTLISLVGFSHFFLNTEDEEIFRNAVKSGAEDGFETFRFDKLYYKDGKIFYQINNGDKKVITVIND